MYSLFDHIAHEESEGRESGRKAVALARARATKRFASFIGEGSDRENRLALVAGDVEAMVRQACADVGYEDWRPVLDTITEHLGGIVVEARRPKMCPYHREVTDISLATGDPQAGFSAMGRHAYGEHSCRGNMWEGGCNFKPDMVTQSYWDQKEEQRAERKRLREAPVLDADAVADATNTNDTVENADSFNDEGIGQDVGQDVTPDMGVGTTTEPAMAMAASKRAATVERPLVHGGSLHPLAAIARNAPGLLIDGQDVDTWGQKMSALPEHPTCEVTHPNPQLEAVAARILEEGHGGPLHEFLAQFNQPRTAEALKTIDVEQPVGPSPKMDKGKWTPDSPKVDAAADAAEMDGTPHPTRRVDIVEPINWDNDFTEYTDAVTEKQDVTQGSSYSDDKKVHKWPSGGDRSAISSTDPEKNPIREAVLDLPSEEDVQRAIAAFKGN